MENKKKLFNLRILVYICLMLISGIVFFVFQNSNLIIAFIFLGVIFGLNVFVCFKNRRYAIFIIGCISFIVGLFGMYFANKDFKPPVYSGECEIVGRIETSKINAHYISITLEDVKINGKESNYKVLVAYYTDTDFDVAKVGNYVRLTTEELNVNEFFSKNNLPNSYNLDNKIGYSCRTFELQYLRNKLTPAEKFKNKVNGILNNQMSTKNAEFLFSALFGEKYDLSKETYKAFKATGVAHIIAVSGLHVGIIAGAIVFMLKKLKANHFVIFLITMPFIICYCYFCNFTHSAERATIMMGISLLAPMVKREYDSLSSLSFAGIALMLFKPYLLFDCGTLMSFSSVLAIILLGRVLTNLFIKMKMPKILASTLALSIAPSLGILMCCVIFFQEFSLYSILANIVILPIFTLLFTIAFFVVLISLIIPPIANILHLINPLFSVITLLSYAISKLPNAVISTKTISFIVFLLYELIMVCVSNYVLIKTKSKLLFASIIGVFLIVLVQLKI